MGRKAYNLDSTFFCTKCGKQGFGIPRKQGSQREVGHLKKLWCIYCKEERNMAETKEYTKYSREMFKLEYENNNFDNEGNRILEISKFKEKMNNEGKLNYNDGYTWLR